MGWNKQYPPDNQECTRNELIERVQVVKPLVYVIEPPENSALQ
jgi:endonuclease I